MRPPTPKKKVVKKKVVSKGLGDRGTSKKKPVVKKKPGFLAQAGSGIAAVAGAVGGSTTAPATKTPTRTTTPAPKTSTDTGGTYDPTTKTVSGGSSGGTSTDDGRPDPFEGTPYAGMTPFQVAQKMVQEEIDSQRESILKAQALAQSKGTQDLNTLLGFNQALQQASSQIAPTYSNLLSQIGDSHTNFANGYQDALKTMQAQGAPLPPGATPGFAPPPNPGASNAAAGSFIDAAQLSNPFSVLPAAYGRLGQMDATLLAKTQADDIANTYGSQLADLNKGQAKAEFDQWQQLQGLWDDTMNAWQKAQDDQAATIADQQAAAHKQAQEDQKTYQWQYSQAIKQQNYLTETTGTMWMVDPKTLRVTQVIQNGQPVLTAKAKQQGATNARLTQSQRLAKARNAESVRYHNLTLQQRREAAAAQKANRSAYKPAPDAVSKQYGWMMVWDPTTSSYTYALGPNGQRQKYKAKAGSKGSAANTPGTPEFKAKQQGVLADARTKAAQLRIDLAGKYKGTVTIPQKQDDGTTVYIRKNIPRYNKNQIRHAIWAQYIKKFTLLAKQLGYAQPRLAAEHWVDVAAGIVGNK